MLPTCIGSSGVSPLAAIAAKSDEVFPSMIPDTVIVVWPTS